MANQLHQQLQQDLQNELTISNQLLQLISTEIQQIRSLTSPGGKFESIIKENATLAETLANMKKIDIENIPPVTRKKIDLSNNEDQNMSYEQHETFRNDSNDE